MGRDAGRGDGRAHERVQALVDNEEFVGVVSHNRRRIKALIGADVDDKQFDEEVTIRPKCRFGKDIAVTARGYIFPCTSCESADQSTWFSINREHFSLHTRTAAEILASPRWQELEASWRKASTAPGSCLYYCGTHRAFDELYDTESRPDRPNKPRDQLTVRIAPGESPTV